MDAVAIIGRDAQLVASRGPSCAERVTSPPWQIVVAILLLAVSMQSLIIYRAVVPALDAVRYVAEARTMARMGIGSTLLHSADDAPLYPAAISLVFDTLEPWLATRRDGWALAAQLSAAFALVLTAPLVFAFASHLVDRRAAVLAAVLFCVLPEFARLGGDAISDSFGLLFLAAILACTLTAANSTRQLLLPILGGGAAATSLFVGQEALVLLAAIAAMAIRPVWRSTALLTLLGVVVALVAWYGAGQLFRESTNFDGQGSVSAVAPLPVKESTASIRFHGYAAAIGAAARALPRTLHYVLVPLAGWGFVVQFRKHRARRDRIGFVLLFGALYLGAAVLYAARAGYLEPRHLLPVALVLLPWCAAGAIAAGEALTGAIRSRRTLSLLRWSVAGPIVLACVMQTAKPLHGRRTPHRDAARWLAAHADPQDCVLDSRGWTGLLSGLTSYTFRESAAALVEPRLRYLVLERHELGYDSLRSRMLEKFVVHSDGPPLEFDSPTGDPGQDVLVVCRGPAGHEPRMALDSSSDHSGDRLLAP